MEEQNISIQLDEGKDIEDFEPVSEGREEVSEDAAGSTWEVDQGSLQPITSENDPDSPFLKWLNSLGETKSKGFKDWEEEIKEKGKKKKGKKKKGKKKGKKKQLAEATEGEKKKSKKGKKKAEKKTATDVVKAKKSKSKKEKKKKKSWKQDSLKPDEALVSEALAELLANQGHLRFITSQQDLDDQMGSDVLGIILSMEGADPIVEPEELEVWWKRWRRARGPV